MPHHADDLATRTDRELVDATRAGHDEAYAELWTRYYQAGLSAARSVTSTIDPDDLTQEAFASILGTIRHGGGPDSAFRSYLMTSIRNTAASWGSRRREDIYDEWEGVADPHCTEQENVRAWERNAAATAFRALPRRWQVVLWLAEVERYRTKDIASLLDVSQNAAAQLAFRARHGLRAAWIQAHLRDDPDRPECQWVVSHLGEFAHGTGTITQTCRVARHLQMCARCEQVADEAHRVSARLGAAGGRVAAGLTPGEEPRAAVSA